MDNPRTNFAESAESENIGIYSGKSNYNGIGNRISDDVTETTTTGITLNTESIMGKEHKNKEKSADVKIFQYINLFAHISTAVYFIIVIYLCCKKEFQFFTWHPLLLSVGWLLLMTEGILSISKSNILTNKQPGWLRVRLHWVFLVIGTVLVISGFIVVYINKNLKNKNHFTSWHGLLGLLGIILAVPSCLNGTATLYHKELKSYVVPKLNKLIHVVCGTLAYIFGGLSLILSVYTKWFGRQSDHSTELFIISLVLVIIAVTFTLVKPTISSLKRIKNFFFVKTAD